MLKKLMLKVVNMSAFNVDCLCAPPSTVWPLVSWVLVSLTQLSLYSWEDSLVSDQTLPTGILRETLLSTAMPLTPISLCKIPHDPLSHLSKTDIIAGSGMW